MRAIHPPSQTLNAMAIILAQSHLRYNQDGKERLTLKLLLGQKNTLCQDSHPFTNKEVLHVTAHESMAVYIDQCCQPADEILITLSLDVKQKDFTLHAAQKVTHNAQPA